jgi:hypothetical protein
MATRPYHGNQTGRSVKEWKVAVLSLMETLDTSAQAQCEPRMGGGCEQSTTTRSKNLKYSVNRARVAAVDFNFNIDYEVEKPPGQYPIGGPRVVSVMKVEGDFLLQVKCEPRMGGGGEL